jgi:hypothetical protein
MAARIMTGHSPRNVWADPTLFPHTIDAKGQIFFVRTRTERIRQEAFLDGRASFWEERGPKIAATAFERLTEPTPPRRLLLHMAFNGSTFAARALDVLGKTLALREPAIEIAIADLAVQGLLDPQVLPIVDALLSRPQGAQAVFSKPSNWANVLLPYWISAGARVALMTIAPRPYLTAVFRGGRDRIAYVLRSSAHFARAIDGSDALIQAASAAIRAGERPLAPAARLVLVALALQYQLFARAPDAIRVSADEIRAAPFAALARVRTALALPVDDLELEVSIRATSHRHAKAHIAYDPTAEARVDAEVESHHGATFDAALNWAAKAGLQFR